MKKLLKVCLFLILTLIVLLLSLAITFYIATKNVKFNPENFTDGNNTIEICSNLGNQIAIKNAKTNGNYVNIEDLNEHTKQAFIAIEDKRFYQHNGIDYKRIIGATLSNIKNLSFKEGASTITQQLVKNTHLSSEKTISRKLKEIKIALEVEKIYEKDKILELYLNTIYFGNGAYGIESASNVYFSKNASDLSINESAMLAGLIKAPNKYSPINNYNESTQRKNLVLKVMYDCGYLTNNQYERLKKEKITIVNEKSRAHNDDYINAVLLEYENSKYFNPYAKNVKINTYLDEQLQRNIYNIRCENYSNSKIVINSKNNGVIAYFGKNSNMKRSPASCVKAWLIYAPMINDGYIKESSVVNDEIINFNGYSPKNFNGVYHGNVTIKQAIAESLNVPAVKLLSEYGIDKVNNYTKKMGINVSNQSLPIALGAIEGGLTLKELCDCYSVFNNDGNYTKSSFIKSVYYNNLKIYEHNPNSFEVFNKETTYIINDALNNAVHNGTSKKLRSLPFEVCAKTGTNGTENGNIDALSVSYTSEHIVGTWIGNDNGSLMPNVITGGNEPTQIAYNILTELYKNGAPKAFEQPTNVVKLNIDNEILLKDKIEVIKNDGEPYCYVVGTEPKIYYESYLTPTIANTKINVNGNLLTINFTLKNAEYIEIERIFNDNKKVVYKGSILSEYKEYLADYGIYKYTLTATKNGKKTTFNFSNVNYLEKNHAILSSDKWLTT